MDAASFWLVDTRFEDAQRSNAQSGVRQREKTGDSLLPYEGESDGDEVWGLTFSSSSDGFL